MQEDTGGKSNCGLAGVRSAVELIQERFADQANVPVQLVRLLLAQDTASALPHDALPPCWHIKAALHETGLQG